MLTSTTSSRAKGRPSYQGVEPEPMMKAPPWIHTITGRFPSSHAGVHTLSVRQSSSITGCVAPISCSMPETVWGATGLNSVASLTPSHGATGWGGRNRSSPTGGAA